jgi:pimeloyl-ACP methyl ester carboxylesterase
MRAILALALPLGFAQPASADGFVLVHGAFQAASSWEAVAERLRAEGHRAVTVSLPGRAGDGRAPGDVTLADHVAAVVSTMNGVPGTVTLVGHSFGGMVISAVAEAVPNRIDELVYVAAYLPAVDVAPGESMQDLASADRHGAWKADSFVPAADYSSATVNPRDRQAIFASDAPAALAQQIADDLAPEPLAPFATPVALTGARFGSVRKAYVVTLADQAVSTTLQLRMLGRARVDEAIALHGGHLPQIVRPDDLAAALLAASTPELE